MRGEQQEAAPHVLSPPPEHCRIRFLCRPGRATGSWRRSWPQRLPPLRRWTPRRPPPRCRACRQGPRAPPLPPSPPALKGSCWRDSLAQPMASAARCLHVGYCISPGPAFQRLVRSTQRASCCRHALWASCCRHPLPPVCYTPHDCTARHPSSPTARLPPRVLCHLAPQAPMLSVDNMEPAAAVATLRQALEGLSTLSAQRAALEEALKVGGAGGARAGCLRPSQRGFPSPDVQSRHGAALEGLRDTSAALFAAAWPAGALVRALICGLLPKSRPQRA